MPAIHAAEQADDPEIEYLLNQVGDSGCVFIRNGGEHSAADAEDHLRMKYRRGRKYFDNADEFIKRIASKSSWSGKPYRLRCGDAQPEPTGAWLAAMLKSYRNETSGP